MQSVGKTQLRRVRYVSRNAAGALINDGIWVFRASALGTSKSRNEIPVARVLFSSRFLWRFDHLNFTGATSPQKASGASALSKHPPTPPTQRRAIMDRLLIATIALVTVFSISASALLCPLRQATSNAVSYRDFATFQTYRGMWKRILRCSLPNRGARVGTLLARSTMLPDRRLTERRPVEERKL